LQRTSQHSLHGLPQSLPMILPEMKQICWLILILLVPPGLIAQGGASATDPNAAAFARDKLDIGPFVFLADVQLEAFDLVHLTKLDTVRVAKRGNVFEVVTTLGIDKEVWMVIRLWEFHHAKRDEIWLSEEDNGKFFALSLNDFQLKAQHYPRTTSLSFGALMVPVKLRFRTENVEYFDFSKDVSMGTSVGVRQGLSRFKPYYASLLLSTGMSLVSALPQNSGGFVTAPTDLAAFTASMGTILDLDGVQLGIFSGIDMVPREAGGHWIYQNKPWFSMGIGYQFMSWDKGVGGRGNNK
jgi:hypothetical protein